MKAKVCLLVLVMCGIFWSCDKDDEASSESELYKGVDTSASAANLKGIWAIYNVGFQGNVAEVPVVYPDCGRDFLVFSENGMYTEYAYQQSDCVYTMNTLNWTLNKGIIKLSSEFGQSDDLVITKLNANELVFKTLFDVNDDGALDVVSLFLKRYIPKEIDMVTPTFRNNQDPAFDDLISFSWQSYEGFNDFVRYEIYRSADNACNILDAQLVASISDVNSTVYTDLTPPIVDSYLCYYLKVYTDRGLLGQSYGRSVSPENLQPQPVTLYKPEILNTTIQLNWQASTDPYFSHYELAFSNYDGGTATGQQVYSVAIINDREQTSFLDENPPYLQNPFYVLYVHNIFGNRTRYYNSQVTTYQEVEFKRPEIINISQAQSYAIDPENTIVYFFGNERSSRYSKIYRFNYGNNQMEAISNLEFRYGTRIPIKYVNSDNGGEIIVEQGSDLAVYEASTLKYKYTLDLQLQGVDDFSYSSLGYWIVVNDNNVYTYVRENANITLIDTKPHFTDRQSYYNYQLEVLKNNTLLVGHFEEPTSYLYTLADNGTLNQGQTVSIPILDNWEYDSQYNPAGNYVINFSENRLYSTTNFSLMESFESPYFPSGTSKNGTLIFGSNNDPNWQITPESIHAKKAVIYNRLTKQTSTITTIGYPHIIFENFLGKIISISSGLKKDNIQQNINDRSDLFVEIIERP